MLMLHRARRRDRPVLALVALALAALPVGTVLAAAPPQERPFIVAETGKGYVRLQDAVDAIGDRSGTIRLAPHRYLDCAVQSAGSIAYVAAQPGSAILDGRACEGKAALVLRGRSAKVVGLVFQNLRVPDGNGAGIRLERGDLYVGQSVFRDSQEGILAGDDPAASIVVERSTFSRLGTCEGAGGCAHGVYIGNYGALVVRRSRFEQGRGGHYVKSRAARIEVSQSSFDDSRGHATNYMIDLSNGAGGTIADNWFVQGADKENHGALIAVAAEGRRHSSTGLAIAGNDARLAPGVDQATAFVADWSGDRLSLGQNRVGPGITRFVRK